MRPSTALRAGPLTYASIATAAVAARLPFLLRADRFFDADEAVEGLMARHVLTGEHSLFLWGQRYKGVPEVYFSSAIFRVAGSSVIALKAATLAVFVVFLCLNFRLLERVFSRGLAWTATALFIVGPPSLVLWTLSGSAEIAWTMMIGAVLLLAVEAWRRTDSSPPKGSLYVAAAALGFGLWVQQYILFYIVSLALTAAMVTPGWRGKLREAFRTRVPAWLRVVMLLLASVAALYVALGLVAFFTSGFDVRIAGARITATHPQKMWWIAGALLAGAAAIGIVSVFRTQLVGPALAFLIGYSPALLGRIGNSGMGSPISRLDFHGLLAALPDMRGVMLPMLLGLSDPQGHRTMILPLGLALLALAALSYWSAWRRKLMPFFHVLPIVAVALFLASGSYIDAQSYRYLMPIYAALPVVYAVGIESVWLSSRAAGAALLIFMLLMFSTQQIGWYRRLEPDRATAETIACLDRSGVRTARAGYWQSYKLTFLTNERVIVSPTDGVDRYAPYSARTRGAASLESIQAACRTEQPR